MALGVQPVVVRLTMAQALRCEKLATYLWPQEKLSVEEISLHLLLEHLLWQESEKNLIESVWISPQRRCCSTRPARSSVVTRRRA